MSLVKVRQCANLLGHCKTILRSSSIERGCVFFFSSSVHSRSLTHELELTHTDDRPSIVKQSAWRNGSEHEGNYSKENAMLSLFMARGLLLLLWLWLWLLLFLLVLFGSNFRCLACAQRAARVVLVPIVLLFRLCLFVVICVGG